MLKTYYRIIAVKGTIFTISFFHELYIHILPIFWEDLV